MKRELKYIAIVLLLSAFTCKTAFLYGKEKKNPPHIAYNIKAEKIRYTNDSVKITWSMDKSYEGDFVVGRSETGISTSSDVLKSKLVGIFNPALEGVLIDRGLMAGKKYYYVVIAKDRLLKREIELIKGVNYTDQPVSLFIEPGMADSIEADTKWRSVKISWDNPKGEGLKFNVYRSMSAIKSERELGVAKKIATTEDDSFTDRDVPEYGSYFYAVTVLDKNGIEYYTPLPGKNFTTQGVYIKGKTLSTPLNVGAYLGEKRSVIVKWEKAKSRTGKTLSGYEIYRSEEMIDSIFRLKFARLIKITEKDTLIYTDRNPGAGKFFYAVFPRYSDGSVDIGFGTASNHTKTPVVITIPYEITSINAQYKNGSLIIGWNFTGNSGPEKIKVFRSAGQNPGLTEIKKNTLASENIKSRKLAIDNPEAGRFYYGIVAEGDEASVKFTKGRNITTSALNIEHKSITEKRKARKISDDGTLPKENGNLDEIIRNTFYKGRYRTALKELKNFIAQTDNKRSREKAMLFMGKAHLELGEYRKSIGYFTRPDVSASFPDESEFWMNFALKRLE